MHQEGYDARGKCIAAVNRGGLGDLLSMEHRQIKVSEWCCLKNTKNQLVHKESHSFAFQTTLVYNCTADFSNIRFCSSHFTRCPCMCLH